MVSTSTDDTFADYQEKVHAFKQIVTPDDPGIFIHIPIEDMGGEFEVSGNFQFSLTDIELARIIHEKCAIKAKPLISFTTMRMGCLMEFFAMKSLAQAFGGLGRFRAI